MSEQSIQRKLAAILYADVAGYSRLTGADEVGTHEALRTGLAILSKAIESNGGRINHYAGDAILAEFGSVVDCVNTAIRAQGNLADENADLPKDKKLLFRIGVHSGEVMIDGTEIYGDDVNIAARLETLADVGGICVSGLVADQVRHRIDVEIEDMGDQEVKNIANPIRAYRILLDKKAAPVAQVSAGKNSIAVLPFDNLSGDPEQEYFSDGIAEDIITALSGINKLHVTARNSTFSYKGQSPNIRDVAKDLDVRYVLEGSVRKAGNKVRITTQLIDGETGNHVWAERYDRELEDIFAVQDEITETVIGAIQPEMSRAEMERARAKHPDNLDAWDLYQRGMFHQYRHHEGDAEIAVDLLAQSTHLAPELASAHAGLAYALAWLARENMSFERVDEAIAAGNRAINLDSDDPACHIALGSALAVKANVFDGNFGDAISSLEFGLSLNPTSALAHAECAQALCLVDRNDEAINHVLTAIRLSPRDLNLGRWMTILGISYFANGNYEATVEWTTKARQARVAFLWLPFAARVAALAYLDRLDEAGADLVPVLETYPTIRETLLNWRGGFGSEVLAGLEKAGLPDG